jgi:tripartite-type tricarboxylate transporter receptor subunit TctC
MVMNDLTIQRRQLILASAAVLAHQTSFAQDKPIRIVVPFAPGGSGDLIPRIVAPVLSEILGQPVIVENRAGAGGSVGTTKVAKSAPDGLTLGVATVSTHGIFPAVMKRAPYDPVRDFSPITSLARVPNVVSVHPSVKANKLEELIALARHPNSRLDYGTPGVGSLGHMLGELFKQSTQSFMTHIPYRGAGPALQDAIAGQVQVLFDNLPASLPHIQAGRLRALAIAWPTRIAQFPNVPTFAEAGLPLMNGAAWFGLVAPAGTSAATVQRYQRATSDALARSEVRSRIEALGAVPIGNVPAAFGQEMQDELRKWQEVAKIRKISLDSE